MQNLKQKAIKGVYWNFINNLASLGVQFIVGIILARILSPREFGLVGMLTIFIAISQSFIDSGFSSALIRKKDCKQTDYSTVFYFNLGIGLFFYFILFISANAISSFFNEPQLELILKVLGLGLVLNALSIIQSTILTKEINFKTQTIITILASIGSGGVAIVMALLNYGVWSLVALTTGRYALNTLFLWVLSKWRPTLVFSKKSFNELFSFGSKLLLSGLIETAYRNIYLLVIGKYFSAQDLGFYTRADQFQKLPSQTVLSVIQRVSYPVLSSFQNDNPVLKKNFRIIVRSTMFIVFILLLGLAVVAKPLILTLVGEKWLPSVIYLQLLCFVGVIYPINILNLNILQVKGRSDVILRLEFIKKAIAIPIIIIGIMVGIKAMIVGMIIEAFIQVFIHSYWSGKLIGYNFSAQIKDVLPSFLLAIVINGCVFLLGLLNLDSNFLMLSIQIVCGAILTILICEITNFKDYKYLKTIIIQQLSRKAVK